MFTTAALKFIWQYRKFFADLAAVLAVCLALTWLHHHIYQQGYAAGAAKVQAQWDAAKAREAQLVAAQQAQASADVSTAYSNLSAQLARRDAATASAMRSLQSELSAAVYRECHVTAGGVRLYDAAGSPSTENPVAGVGAGALPAARSGPP